jgi:hypothetical protein
MFQRGGAGVGSGVGGAAGDGVAEGGAGGGGGAAAGGGRAGGVGAARRPPPPRRPHGPRHAQTGRAGGRRRPRGARPRPPRRPLPRPRRRPPPRRRSFRCGNTRRRLIVMENVLFLLLLFAFQNFCIHTRETNHCEFLRFQCADFKHNKSQVTALKKKLITVISYVRQPIILCLIKIG